MAVHDRYVLVRDGGPGGEGCLLTLRSVIEDCKGGEIQATRTLNLFWVDVPRFSTCVINLSRNKIVCCRLSFSFFIKLTTCRANNLLMLLKDFVSRISPPYNKLKKQAPLLRLTKLDKGFDEIPLL